MSPPSRWPFLLLVLAGLAAVALMKQNRAPPKQQPLSEQAVPARFIEIPSLDFTPTFTGHGTVQPARVWEAMSQVKGKVVFKHEQLRRGAILKQGTLILRIDPTDYQLEIARIEADIAAARAQLAELSIKEGNSRAALTLEEQSLDLLSRELERKRDLVDRGGISTSDLESQERALLAQRQQVLGQHNTLNLIPSQRSVLEAQLLRHQTSLDTARLNLQRTEIRMPFTGRMAEVPAELDRYVREGDRLLEADDLALAEIEVQVPIDRFAALIRSPSPIDLLRVDRQRLSDSLQLGVRVRMRERGLEARWNGKFSRVSDTLDPKTRTIGAIVEVADPYSDVQPGIRPPLFKGLFVEVELSGRSRPDSLVIPRHALYGDQVYLIKDNNRLELRKVEIAQQQGQLAVVATGVDAGERLVVSDLVPAIDGMLLEPQPAEDVLSRLIAHLAREE